MPTSPPRLRRRHFLTFVCATALYAGCGNRSTGAAPGGRGSATANAARPVPDTSVSPPIAHATLDDNAKSLQAKEQRPMTTKSSMRTYAKPPDADLRSRLSPVEYKVTQEEGTEPPFANRYWNNHDVGLYVDTVTGEPLFSSLDKFESGTGWPSFTRPVDPERVVSKTDRTLGMARTEVRSHGGNSHLGHVFEDGPAPTGLRYCINSASLRFIPVEKLEAEGYGDYRPLFAPGTGK